MQANNNVLFRSFGRESAGNSTLYCPTTIDDVRSVFQIAKQQGRRVTVRAGGHSFHDQALHDGDMDKQIIVSPTNLNMIRPAPNGDPNTVLLGAGVQWVDYFNWAVEHARTNRGPLRLPGSIQTGRRATAGGTASGDCLSRFSAILGKESRWIESFRLLTTDGNLIDVNPKTNSDLFHAVIGGLGYLGFIFDITYKLIAIDSKSCARTNVTTYQSFVDLVDAQVKLIADAVQHSPALSPRAISSVWFTDLADIGRPNRIKGGVFDSSYAEPSDPPQAGFPLYGDIGSHWRYVTELMARFDASNLLIDEFLFALVREHQQPFENDLLDFLFFMDGNTVAKEKFEMQFAPQLFPIIQQTFVVPTDATAAFAETCESRLAAHHLRPTDTDMLFVAHDDCLMSANYQLDGFAVSMAFEPIAGDGESPQNVVDLLHELSVICESVGGRIHMVKHVHADRAVFRKMFDPQIRQFETIKRKYDPDLILQNKFSDRFFSF